MPSHFQSPPQANHLPYPPSYDYAGAYNPPYPPPPQPNSVASVNSTVSQSDYQALLQQLATMQSTLTQLTSQQPLHQESGYYGGGGRGPGGRGPGGRNGGRTGGRFGEKKKRQGKYCFTHGNCAHLGKDCLSPAAGHVASATFQNKQGGSTKNCTT